MPVDACRSFPTNFSDFLNRRPHFFFSPASYLTAQCTWWRRLLFTPISPFWRHTPLQLLAFFYGHRICSIVARDIWGWEHTVHSMQHSPAAVAQRLFIRGLSESGKVIHEYFQRVQKRFYLFCLANSGNCNASGIAMAYGLQRVLRQNSHWLMHQLFANFSCRFRCCTEERG